MSEAALVFVTAGSQEQAALIAHALVGERLAACVNLLGPIRSIYRWQDAVQDESEHLMLIKTRAKLVAKVERRVRELHSYDVPEVIAVSIAQGSAPYLDWLLESTAGSAAERTRRRKRRT
jgi:periplasmic divalent cation tolerance protein